MEELSSQTKAPDLHPNRHSHTASSEAMDQLSSQIKEIDLQPRQDFPDRSSEAMHQLSSQMKEMDPQPRQDSHDRSSEAMNQSSAQTKEMDPQPRQDFPDRSSESMKHPSAQTEKMNLQPRQDSHDRSSEPDAHHHTNSNPSSVKKRLLPAAPLISPLSYVSTHETKEKFPDFYNYRYYDVNEMTDLFDVENTRKYRPGGYHPVHLGDLFDHGRYKVIHKLGSGGNATVWLARDRDEDTYVALKIMLAISGEEKVNRELQFYKLIDSSSALSGHPGRQSINRLLHHFQITGPNGTHACMIYPFAGPNLSTLTTGVSHITPYGTKYISWKLVEAVDFLHSIGICHGDLTARNVVLEMVDISGFSEREIYAEFGDPETEVIPQYDDEVQARSRPRYVVRPMLLSSARRELFTENIQVIDFGAVYNFKEAEKNAFALGTPLQYLPPENMFFWKAGPACDIWSLACIIFKIRDSDDLISLYLSYHWDWRCLLQRYTHTLGSVPKEWKFIHFDDDGNPSRRDEVDSWYEGITIREDLMLEQRVSNIEDDYYHDDKDTEQVLKGRRMLWTPYTRDHESLAFWENGESPEAHADPLKTKKILTAEASRFFDLLRSMLTYEPEERITAQELYEKSHPWFWEEVKE